MVSTLTERGLIKISDIEIEGSVGGEIAVTPFVTFVPELRPNASVEIPYRLTYVIFLYLYLNIIVL